MKPLKICVIFFAHFTLLNSINTEANEDDLFFEMPVVLSASRLEQPVSEAPVAISSLDRQMIEASGARTIPEALRLVPGMVVGYSLNDFGDEPRLVVSYHGLADQFSRRMQVLIDGRSIYEPMLGGVAWNNLPINLDDIERIEVTRGPNASTYGSNSFLAVVNIITRHSAEDKGNFVKTNVGNNGIVDGVYRYGGGEGDLDFRITMATQNDDGQDRANGTATHDNTGTDAFDYRMDYQLSNSSQLIYQGGYSRTISQAEACKRSCNKIDREIKNQMGHQFIKWEKTVSTEESFIVQYYYSLLSKKDHFFSSPIVIPPLDPVVLDFNGNLKSERHNVEFTHFLQPDETLRFVWGASIQKDRGTSKLWLNRYDTLTRDQYRLFSNVEWKLDKKNTLNFGILQENNEFSGTDTSPRLALIHSFNNNHTFRFGISQATRTTFMVEDLGNQEFTSETTLGGGAIPGPTLVQKTLITSGRLEPERITSREIGYYGKLMDNELILNIRLFRDTFKDLIDTPNIMIDPALDNVDGEARTFINSFGVTIQGVETEFNYYYDKSLRFVGYLAYQDIDSDEPENTKVDELKNSAPDKSASLLTIKRFNRKYSGSIGYYFVADMAWLDSNRTENYRKIDLRLSRTFRIGGDTLKASIVIQNAFEDFSDYDVAPFSGVPQVEQSLTAYIQLKASFR